MEREKITQAVALLDELDLDAWLVIDRESGSHSDPMMKFVVGSGVTWLSFFVIFRSGQTAALVGNLDIEKIRRLGLFDRVLPYQGSPKDELLRLLEDADPRRIAVDYSEDSAMCDGLSHGAYLSLLRLLAGTPYGKRLVSAEPLIHRLLGRKSPEELRRIQAAVDAALEIYDGVTKTMKAGMSELQVAAFIRGEMDRLGLPPAWEPDSCPSVFAGPQEVGAHSGPTDKVIRPGYVVNTDFGVRSELYCSDLQRSWYMLKPGETEAPAEVRRAFSVLLESIDRAVAALVPGACGRDVDTACRSVITGAGYPEFPHALGHTVGRSAHDGGPLLAPMWERYGNLPLLPLEAGQVFTVEPRISLPEYGVLTIEEMLVVRESGTARYLSKPQRELWLIAP
ncbi:MAG TPA: M24 family metallopeptidase [Candidatus Aminicenantes bacterium]|nr:M24 family metallopeptidase [Candidatus Aminicenantes bacterium]